MVFQKLVDDVEEQTLTAPLPRATKLEGHECVPDYG